MKCLCDAVPGDVVLDVLLIEGAQVCSKVGGEDLDPVLFYVLVERVQEVLVVLHGRAVQPAVWLLHGQRGRGGEGVQGDTFLFKHPTNSFLSISS